MTLLLQTAQLRFAFIFSLAITLAACGGADSVDELNINTPDNSGGQVTLEPTPAPGPSGTSTPTGAPISTNTPMPTNAPLPTSEPIATETPIPTSTPMPTSEPATTAPTSIPTPTSLPSPATSPTPSTTPTPMTLAEISAIQLVSVTETNELVVIESLMDGDTIDLSLLNSATLNITATIEGDISVGSVHFDLSGPFEINRSESLAPYTLVDQAENWDMRRSEPTAGDYILTVTPYSEAGAKGAEGASLSITFTIERSVTTTPTLEPTPSPEPTSTPTSNPTPAPGEDITVSNDAELRAAIEAGTATVINVSPGNYTASDLVTGIDRSAAPLTIQGLNPQNKPEFLNAKQSLRGTLLVTFRNLRFDNTGALGWTDSWFHDPGGTGNAGLTSDITLDGLDFYSPAPDDLNNPNPVSDYARQLPSLFKFSNYRTHNYTIQNIYADNVYSIGNFRMNGDVLIHRMLIETWYFDGIRILGQGTEGYVEGNRIIANVDILSNIAVYNEIDNASTPHPDNTQVFNSGSTVNNSDPRLRNTLFYQNRFNPGQLRGNSVQAGLSQTRSINVGYVENIFGPKTMYTVSVSKVVATAY